MNLVKISVTSVIILIVGLFSFSLVQRTGSLSDYTVHLESKSSDDEFWNEGRIKLEKENSLPCNVTKLQGTYTAQYDPDSERTFDHWEAEGGINVSSPISNPTNITIIGNGTLRAIYKINTYLINLESKVDGNSSSNLGSIIFEKSRSLPSNVALTKGNQTVQYKPVQGYVFFRWEVEGDVVVSSFTSNPANLVVLGNGTLRVIYLRAIDVMKILRFEGQSGLPSEIRDNGTIVSQFTDMYMHYDKDAIAGIHRNGKKILSYRNFEAISTEDEAYNLALDKGWILKDIFGNYVYEKKYPQNKVLDPNNLGYRKWLTSWIRSRVNERFDGIFADNSIDVGINTDWELSARPVNPLTGEIYTDDDWMNAKIGLINYIKIQVPKATLVCNGVFNGNIFFSEDYSKYVYFFSKAKIDALFSEGTFNNMGSFYKVDEWEKSVQFLAWLQNNFLSNQTKSLVIWSQAEEGLPTDVTRDQAANFIFASSLMGVSKGGQNYVSFHGHMNNKRAQDLFNIPLGKPIDSYQQILETQVFERNFENVKVLVNPSEMGFWVKVGDFYTDMDGKPVTTVFVTPFSGLILLKNIF